MTVGFGRSGLIPDLNFLKGFMVVTALTSWIYFADDGLVSGSLRMALEMVFPSF